MTQISAVRPFAELHLADDLGCHPACITLDVTGHIDEWAGLSFERRQRLEQVGEGALGEPCAHLPDVLQTVVPRYAEQQRSDGSAARSGARLPPADHNLLHALV